MPASDSPRVHFSIGGNAGLVDRYEDAGESACVLAGEGEQMPSARGSLGLDFVIAQRLGAGWLRGCYRRDRLVS